MIHQIVIKSLFILLHLFCLTVGVSRAIMCDEPPAVFNADADLRGLKPPFLNGTVIFYSCHNGYVLQSSSNSSAMCVVENETGYWQLESFNCSSVCNDLPDVPHAILKPNSRKPPFSPGEIIQYVCHKGYITESNRVQVNISCATVQGNASWILPIEPCRPRSCGYPSDIENSIRVGSVFTFPNNVTYICNEGFQLRGKSTIFCTATGNWRPDIPYCDAVLCPLLPFPENGKVELVPGRYYKDVATYECNPKYRLKGDQKRVCQADASWSGRSPTCVEILCLSPGPIPNGRSFPELDKYQIGTLVVFDCQINHHRETSKCLEDGSWSRPPPICEGPPNLNGSTLFPTTESTLTSQSTILPKEKCEDPGEIKNGKRNFTGSTPNVNLTYSCEDGYELRGQGTLTCSPNGKWNIEKLPICVKPIPVSTIIGIIVGVILLILLGVGGYFYYQWRAKKMRAFGKKSKALTTDATDLEEIAGLEKGKKPIPVTVL